MRPPEVVCELNHPLQTSNVIWASTTHHPPHPRVQQKLPYPFFTLPFVSSQHLNQWHPTEVKALESQGFALFLQDVSHMDTIKASFFFFTTIKASYDTLKLKQRNTEPWKPSEMVMTEKSSHSYLWIHPQTTVVNMFLMNNENKTLALELNKPQFALWLYQLARKIKDIP